MPVSAPREFSLARSEPSAAVLLQLKDTRSPPRDPFWGCSSVGRARRSQRRGRRFDPDQLHQILLGPMIYNPARSMSLHRMSSVESWYWYIAGGILSATGGVLLLYSFVRFGVMFISPEALSLGLVASFLLLAGIV